MSHVAIDVVQRHEDGIAVVLEVVDDVAHPAGDTTSPRTDGGAAFFLGASFSFFLAVYCFYIGSKVR